MVKDADINVSCQESEIYGCRKEQGKYDPCKANFGIGRFLGDFLKGSEHRKKIEKMAEKGGFTPLVCRPTTWRLALGGMARINRCSHTFSSPKKFE